MKIQFCSKFEDEKSFYVAVKFVNMAEDGKGEILFMKASSIAFNKNILFKLFNFQAQRHFVCSSKFKACKLNKSFRFCNVFTFSENMESIQIIIKVLNSFFSFQTKNQAINNHSRGGKRQPPSSQNLKNISLNSDSI